MSHFPYYSLDDNSLEEDSLEEEYPFDNASIVTPKSAKRKDPHRHRTPSRSSKQKSVSKTIKQTMSDPNNEPTTHGTWKEMEGFENFIRLE